MNTQTELLTLNDAATLLKVSVDGLLTQATEGLVQLYWLLNKTLYSDNMELQPMGVFPAYYGQDREEWESNLTLVHSTKHFTFIPLRREQAGELLAERNTVCWVSEIRTTDEIFSLPEPTAFTITRQQVVLMRDDAADWNKHVERFVRPTGDALNVRADSKAIGMIPHNKGSKWTDDELRNLQEEKNKGQTPDQLADFHGVSRQIINTKLKQADEKFRVSKSTDFSLAAQLSRRVIFGSKK